MTLTSHSRRNSSRNRVAEIPFDEVKPVAASGREACSAGSLYRRPQPTDEVFRAGRRRKRNGVGRSGQIIDLNICVERP